MIDIVRPTRFALQHVWRNLWLSLVTLVLLTFTMLSMTLVFGVNVLGSRMITAVQQKVDVDFYFHTYVPETDILEVQGYIRTLPQTKTVSYTSADQALKDFTNSHQDDPAILASLSELGENVLPGSLTVTANRLSEYQRIIDSVEESEYADLVEHTDFSDNSSLIGRIQNMTRVARQGAVGIMSIFLLIAVIVMFNTFRITIYNYRDEIRIMKLVGATNLFIRAPFLLEGFLLGLLSAALTILISYIVLYSTDPAVRTFFTGYDFSLLAYTNLYWIRFVLSEIIVAVGLSVLFTMVALTRYLKV